MVRALAALSRGGLGFTPQAEDGVTYASKIDKAETRIDWSRPAAEVHNHIRGLSPDPGAWFEADLGKQRGARQGAALDARRGFGRARRRRRRRAHHRLRRRARCAWPRSSAPARGRSTAAEFLRGLRAPLAAVG